MSEFHDKHHKTYIKTWTQQQTRQRTLYYIKYCERQNPEDKVTSSGFKMDKRHCTIAIWLTKTPTKRCEINQKYVYPITNI